jgi:hypothetical protein
MSRSYGLFSEQEYSRNSQLLGLYIPKVSSLTQQKNADELYPEPVQSIPHYHRSEMFSHHFILYQSLPLAPPPSDDNTFLAVILQIYVWNVQDKDCFLTFQ